MATAMKTRKVGSQQLALLFPGDSNPVLASATELGLDMAATKKKQLKFDAWLEGMERLTIVEKASNWDLGDALILGRERWPEDHAQAFDPHWSMANSDKIAQCLHTSDSYAMTERYQVLTWTHHRDALQIDGPKMALPRTARFDALDHAVDQKMNTTEFRAYIKTLGKTETEDGPPKTTVTKMVAFTVAQEDEDEADKIVQKLNAELVDALRKANIERLG